MLAPAPTLETRICRSCDGEFPLSEFRRRRRGSEEREGDCCRCHAENVKQWRARKRALSLGRGVRSIGRNPTDKRMRRVVERLLAAFGGVDGFLAEWLATLQAARERDPLGQFVKDSMIAVARLVEHGAVLQSREEAEQREWLGTLTVEELREENRRLLAGVLRDCPDMAAAVLREAGWLVIPPAAVKAAG